MNTIINSRNYTTIHPLQNEFDYLPDKNYLFDLDYLTTLLVEGEKGSDFLQGQLSCDMHAVTSTQMQKGLMCNLKGRILAALDVVALTNKGYALVVPNDLFISTQATLAKPAPFSRVQLSQMPSKIYGFYAQSEESLLPLGGPLPTDCYGVIHYEKGCCYKIDKFFYMVIVHPEDADECCLPFIKQDQYRGSLAWHALQLRHLHVDIYPESQGLFLPHRLDMHKTGYLSFDKGCYKGQEIIARMHYRATQKYTLVVFNIKTDQPIHSGLALYSEDSITVVGEVVDYCTEENGQVTIAASVLITHAQSATIDCVDGLFILSSPVRL